MTHIIIMITVNLFVQPIQTVHIPLKAETVPSQKLEKCNNH